MIVQQVGCIINKSAMSSSKRAPDNIVRRQRAMEMILEPMVGLRSEDYAVDWTANGSGVARAIEETARRFYADMAGRISASARAQPSGRRGCPGL